MVHIRAEKVAGIADDIPELEVDDPDGAELLVLGWGSTWGVAQQAVRQARDRACRSRTRTSCTSTRSRGTSARCSRGTERVLVPEMNLGQLSRLVRAEFLVDARSLSKVQGLPFRAAEVESAIEEMVK